MGVALAAAMVATTVSAGPVAAAEAQEAAQLSDELREQLEALGEDLDIEAPQWEDSPSAPIMLPDEPEMDLDELPQPRFPRPGKLQQSLSDAAVAALEASADRPVVVRPAGGRNGAADASDGESSATDDAPATRTSAEDATGDAAPETATDPAGSAGDASELAAPAGEAGNDGATGGDDEAEEGSGASGDQGDGSSEPTTTTVGSGADTPDEADAAGDGADAAAPTTSEVEDGTDGESASEVGEPGSDVSAAGEADARAGGGNGSTTPGRGRGAGALNDVEVTVLDRAAADHAGVSGFVFIVGAKGAASLGQMARDGRRVPVEMEIDYTGFASAYGADYAGRLQVVALPACAVEEPVPAGCNVAGQRLESRNLRDEGKLVVEVPDLADLAVESAAPLGIDALLGEAASAEDIEAAADKVAAMTPEVGAEDADGDEPESPHVPEGLAPFASTDGNPVAAVDGSADGRTPSVAARTAEDTALSTESSSDAVVLAVTSGTSSDTGNFGATPQSPTGQWSAATGSGEFSWSYPIELPAPPGGSAPEVGLSYSSGAIDGLTLATNTQASQNGIGFGDFASSFIERSYEPCVNAGLHTSTDLCWKGHVATISLGGVAGPLVPLDTNGREYRVENDPGWKIERIGDETGQIVTGETAPEYWRVTGPDGTEYYFGLNKNPDTGNRTDSLWWAPITSDHQEDPCYGNLFNPEAAGMCNMGWRWNLDRVVDPHGMVTTYRYYHETGHYDAWNGLWDRQPYIRGGALRDSHYGQRDGGGPAAARVIWGRQYRCVFLVDDCGPAEHGNTGGFPDVPVDLICPNSGECGSTTPSFFSTKRYSHVRTEVRDPSVEGGWRAVAQHNFAHQFLGTNGSTNCWEASKNCKLYLTKIQHHGIAQGGVDEGSVWDIYPTTNFSYANGYLPNRVDTGGPAMRHRRITRIRNPLGGLVEVAYGQQHGCDPDHHPSRWDDPDHLGNPVLNRLDCFPQKVVDDGFTRTGVFHKWLVTQVKDSPGHGSPAITTSYDYEGDPAWAFDWGAFSRNDVRWGWSSWRGYDTTKITQGSSVSRVRTFRGMHGDPVLQFCPGSNELTIGCETRDQQVTTLDGSLSYDDDLILMGRAVEEASYGTVDGVADQIVEATRTTYEIRQTQTPAPDRSPPRWAGVSATTERVSTSPGVFRERGTTTTYNANQQPATTEELGWLDETGDERCSTTTYVDNPDLGMFVYPSTNTVVEGTCDNPGATLSATQTFYDGTTTEAPPTKGDVTLQRSLVEAPDTWAETTTTFDVFGRPLTVTDPEGHTTTTEYSPAASISPEMAHEVTVSNELGHESSTELMIEHGLPRRETDPNGNVTSYTYDGFGRTTTVCHPTEQPCTGGDEPSWRYSYHLDDTYAAPPVVRSRRLTSTARQGEDVVFEDMWEIHDGHGRQRQTHTLSPESGKVIVDATTYDSQGRVKDDIVPQAQTGTPGQGLISGNPPYEHRTRYSYDEMGRTVAETFMEGGANGIPVHTTTHEYGPDWVTVTGPEGNKVRETVDGLGRTVEVAEHDGTDWVTTDYGYDLAGNLTSVTDPEGHQLTYIYDLAGRRTSQSDPNRGAASFTYDLAGNRITSTDAEGNVIHTSYDVLGRPTERREGGPTGTLLASWDYDAPDEAGQLDRSTRHDATGDWISDVVGYDPKGRALGTTLTVPAGLPGLSGDYTVSQTYDRADRVVTQVLPAVGDLPVEALLTAYNELGLPEQTGSLVGGLIETQDYVRTTNYDDRGRPTLRVLGEHDPNAPVYGVWMAQQLAYNDYGQLASTTVYNSTLSPDWTTPAVRHQLTYNDAGLVTDRTSELAGLGAWRECYDFDARLRLTDAHTVALGESCTAGTPGGGAQPYQHAYTYSPGNRLEERTEDGQTTTHSYPAAGQPRPYAPVQVGDVTFEWDENGNLTERTEDGATDLFSWDAERRLESVSGADGDASFVYDAGGQRLLRTTDDGSTLYFAGHEITATPDGSTVTAVRSISHAGQTVATRDGSGVDFLVTDERGSVEGVAPAGGAPSYERAYEPYGSERAADGQDPATDRGFLGQVEDGSTGLSYLNARYYDTDTSAFLSPDPVYDTKNIKTLNPYTYGQASPTSFSDASGLSPSYTLGVERQNWSLRQQNKQLIGHIEYLGGQMQKMQNVIKKQQNAITELLGHISAMEAVIRQQARVIDQLNARVAYLTQQVNYWRNQAYYWRGQAMYWRSQAIYWRGQAMYWKGQAMYWRGQAYYWRGQAIHWKGVAQYRGAVINGLIDYIYGPSVDHIDGRPSLATLARAQIFDGSGIELVNGLNAAREEERKGYILGIAYGGRDPDWGSGETVTTYNWGYANALLDLKLEEMNKGNLDRAWDAVTSQLEPAFLEVFRITFGVQATGCDPGEQSDTCGYPRPGEDAFP